MSFSAEDLFKWLMGQGHGGNGEGGQGGGNDDGGNDSPYLGFDGAGGPLPFKWDDKEAQDLALELLELGRAEFRALSAEADGPEDLKQMLNPEHIMCRLVDFSNLLAMYSARGQSALMLDTIRGTRNEETGEFESAFLHWVGHNAFEMGRRYQQRLLMAVEDEEISSE